MSQVSSKGKRLVVVGTTNSLKVEAIKLSLQNIWKEEEFDVKGLKSFKSNVSEYPIGKIETQNGALYRAKYSKENNPSADYWIGIESGFPETNSSYNPYSYVYISIVVLDKNDRQYNYWSYKLKTPITGEQRINQIGNAMQKHLKLMRKI